ncbi:hypothetical protein HJG60_008925 [Phyllostomus discolor]|uniref:Uncharacterized protein n=1 Tax=Phyllostomus discolor TaxID=89673 RepID=A0A834DJB6_9CHIR|nr:hypothetical protein HJG60_008925 [Phyllostomus discolor]
MGGGGALWVREGGAVERAEGCGQLTGGLVWVGGQEPKRGLRPQPVLADDGSRGGQHVPLGAVRLRQRGSACTFEQHEEGALGVSGPGQKPSRLLAAGRPDPGGGAILVTTVSVPLSVSTHE